MDTYRLPVEAKPPGLTTVEELWADASKQFEYICGQSLQRGDVKGFDDVRKQIESAGQAATNQQEDEKARKWEKAKRVGLVSLRLLKTLVQAASQASSVIPIPGSVATVTSTALCFVFDIPETIKGYEDAIDQVFSEVSSSLAQFQIYTSMEKVQQIHPSLVQQIHLVMISFVKLCAHVVKYRQGRRRDRLLQRVKSIFEDDSGLSDEMTEFKRVLQQQRDVEGTVTLGVVVETRRDILIVGKTAEETNQLVSETQEGVQTLRAESERSKTLGKICDALDVPNTVRFDTTTTQTCDNLYAKCLDGTGSWIWCQDVYKRWTAPSGKDKERSPNSHILILSGPASSGKTSAGVMITKRLGEQKGRTFVAHYFWPTNTKRSDDAKRSVQSVLKYMAFQIARVDATVLRALGNVCDAGPSVFRRAGQDNLEQLWEELKIGASGSGATYYLVFDGIENLVDRQAELLLKFAFGTELAGASGRVRVLLSGTDEKFEAMRSIIYSKAAFRIRMQHHNASDMRLVIEDALSKRGMLQNAKPGSRQWKARTEILEKLPRNVRGSYSRLQFGLDDVIRLLSTRTPLQDLDRILDQSTSSHETAIKTLQRSLTADEVGELNKLLMWVLFGGEDRMDLDTLEEAMFLSSGTESLVSLQYIIENKYSAVLRLKDGFAYGQDCVEQYLRSNEKRRAHRGFETEGNGGRQTISMTIAITNVDQEVCGHFLWDLAHKAIRDKFRFEFDTASNSSLHQGGSQAVISVDEFEAHRTIVERTFKYLLGHPPMPETKRIADYLVCWLPYHLKRLRQLEFDEEYKSLTPSEQSEIGQNLYKLFTDRDVFARFHSSFEKIYWTVDEMETIQDWLMDSSVTKRLDKKWRERVKKAVSPTRGVLLDFVKVVVQGFLRERTWDVDRAFQWVAVFMAIENKMFPQPWKMSADDDDGATNNDSSSSSSAASDSGVNWDKVSEWCRGILGLSEAQLDSLWFERLAEACLENDSSGTATALSLCQQALEKSNPSWRCHRGMAMAHASEGQYQKAVAEATLALVEAKNGGASPKPTLEEIVDLQLRLGEYYYELKDWDKMTEFFLSASKSEDPSLAMRGHFGYLRARLFQPSAASVRKHLKSTLSEGLDGGEILMVGLLKKIAQHSEHNRLMARIFTVAHPDRPLLEGIVRAMEAASVQPSPAKHVAEAAEGNGTPAPVDMYAEETTRGVLLYDRGVAAYRYKVAPDGHEPVSEALRLWSESREILSRVGGQSAFNAREGAISGLASHYFQSMVDGNHSEHVAALTQLAEIDSSIFYGDAAGYLGAIHALHGEKALAQAALKPCAELALQVLSDDSPDNDYFGWSVLHPTLEHYRDIRSASVVLSILGQPDLVTEALSMVVPEIEGVSHAKLVATYKELTKQVVEAAISKVPDSSQQVQRIAAAKAHVESLRSARDGQKAKHESDGIQVQEAHELDAKAATSALDIAAARLNTLLEQHSDGLSPEAILDLKWFCNGCTSDGRACDNIAGFDHVFYHCLTCFNREFCPDCFKKLRGPSDPEGVDIMVCSRRHKWLRVPPFGGAMFVGWRAERARVAKEVRPLDDDKDVLEIVWDDELVDISTFKETLAKEWGLSPEQMSRNSSNHDTPKSSDSGSSDGQAFSISAQQ